MGSGAVHRECIDFDFTAPCDKKTGFRMSGYEGKGSQQH